MFGIVNYEMYITSCIILSLIPGNDTMFILGQSITNDRKTGMFSVFGMGSGILVHTLLVSLGLSVILKNSPMAFNVVKLLGAAYLIYMGVKSIFAKNSFYNYLSVMGNELGNCDHQPSHYNNNILLYSSNYIHESLFKSNYISK